MSLADKALWVIERNSGNELTLGSIAAACKVSRSHLANAFGTASGWPVMAYLRARRLSEAARLQWLESNRTRKNAGAVSRATNVAARVSRRHSAASADACSLIEPVTPGLSCAYAMRSLEGTWQTKRPRHLAAPTIGWPSSGYHEHTPLTPAGVPYL